MRASSMIRSVAGGLVLAAALATPTAAQGPPPGSLVPGDAKIAGRSYAQYERAYYKWRLSHTVTPTKNCIATRQSGPVWFIAGNSRRGAPSSWNCTIPAGRYVMVGTPNVDCSTVERAPYRASTSSGLRRCARREFRRHVLDQRVTLDGTQLNPPAIQVATSAFSFTMPARRNFLGLPGVTRGRAAVYADATILTPLSAGPHTLVLSAKLRGVRRDSATFHITAG